MIEKIISLWWNANGQICHKFLFYTVSTNHTNCYNQIERKKCSSVEKWNGANKMVSVSILTNSYAIWSNRRLIMTGQHWWRFLVLRFTLDRLTEPLVRDLHEWLPLFRSSGVYKSFDLKINSDAFKIKMTCARASWICSRYGSYLQIQAEGVAMAAFRHLLSQFCFQF